MQRPFWFESADEVTVLGTPAEEDGGGKVDLLRDRAFDNLDVVFMARPSEDDAVYLLCVAVTIKYHGKASPSLPLGGRQRPGCSGSVLTAYLLRQQMKPGWRVHGVIKHGGVKPNIIPAYSELEFYLRTPSCSELPVLEAKAERCFRSAAVATGCATDFGNVTFAVPGIHPYFFIGSKALNHTEEYTAAAGAAAAQFFALRSVKALAMTALDVLLQKVQQEFTAARLQPLSP